MVFPCWYVDVVGGPLAVKLLLSVTPDVCLAGCFMQALNPPKCVLTSWVQDMLLWVRFGFSMLQPCVLTFEIVGGESESREGYLKKQVVLVPFSKSTKKGATSSMDCLTPTSHLSYLTVTLAVQTVSQSQTLRPWALDTVDVAPKYPYSHGCGRLGDSRVLSCQRWNSSDCVGWELPTLQVLQRATCFFCRPKSVSDATALLTLPVGSAMVSFTIAHAEGKNPYHLANEFSCESDLTMVFPPLAKHLCQSCRRWRQNLPSPISMPSKYPPNKVLCVCLGSGFLRFRSDVEGPKPLHHEVQTP